MNSQQNVIYTLKRKIMDKTFLPRKRIMKYYCLSKETKHHLQNLFEKDPFMDKKCLDAMSTETKIPKNKIKYFFKNLRIKDYKTSKKYIKSIRNYQKFTSADIHILEENFRSNNSLDNENLEYLKKALEIKDPAKIKNWFAYRNRKMNIIIKKDEVASSFVKPLPSFNPDLYLNIVKQLYTMKALEIIKTEIENAYIQQANFSTFALGVSHINNASFAVKKEN